MSNDLMIMVDTKESNIFRIYLKHKIQLNGPIATQVSMMPYMN